MDQIEEDSILQQGGIPVNLIISCPVNVDLLTCPICFNVLWDPVACNQDRCFSSFCRTCIEQWIKCQDTQEDINDPRSITQEVDYLLVDEEDYEQCKNTPNCPKCKRQFYSTEIPIVCKLLAQTKVKCINEDCSIEIPYLSFKDHLSECKQRKERCSGCQHQILAHDIGEHEKNCPQMVIQCKTCGKSMTKEQQQSNHDKYECIQNRFQILGQTIAGFKEKINYCEQDIIYMDYRLNTLKSGELEKLTDYKFSTIFNLNYQFSNDNLNIVRLIRNSFNFNKQKNDFLHFYIDHPIHTILQGYEWTVRIIRLRGYLLIGICSGLQITSIDYIINKSGEIKKKEANDNKYQNVRKVNFSFGEGDVIQFQYLPLARCVRVKNQTRHLIFAFERTELDNMDGQFYSFFSLELQGDALQFL